MITGDQSPTAYAIGHELQLSRNEPLEILDATHLGEMDTEALRALALRAHVFARVSPAHKLMIVQALQQSGQVVAMTGDGINDGPAVKAADVGIAMGRTGTDIARDVADVVLEEDNLDTLLIAIRDGRTTYINIRKSVHFFLSTNLSEIMLTGGGPHGRPGFSFDRHATSLDQPDLRHLSRPGPFPGGGRTGCSEAAAAQPP